MDSLFLLKSEHNLLTFLVISHIFKLILSIFFYLYGSVPHFIQNLLWVWRQKNQSRYIPPYHFHYLQWSTLGHNLYKETPSELERQPGGWVPCFLFAQKLLGFVVVMVCWFCLLYILAWVLQQAKIWTEKALVMLAVSTQRSRKRSKGAGEQNHLVSSSLLQPRWTPTKKRCPSSFL